MTGHRLTDKEPINTGIQHETEKESMGHITRERFQTLLDSQVRTIVFGEYSLLTSCSSVPSGFGSGLGPKVTRDPRHSSNTT